MILKTLLKVLLFITAMSAIHLGFAQSGINYYPSEWNFKNQVDIVDISQVKNITTQDFTIDNNTEYLILETYLNWNNTSQLTSYNLINHLNNDLSFDVQITYENPNGNQLKSVKITDPNTKMTLEERQYTNGSFDIEKIQVKRYLPNIKEPNTFEVIYEGNDDDYIMETVLTPEKTIVKQTKHWFRMLDDEKYKRVKKTYLDSKLVLDQTDSIVLNQNQKILEHHIINKGVSRKTEHIYKTRTVNLYGDDYDYEEVELITKDGKEALRFEYTYDEQGNWTTKKTFKKNNGNWDYYQLTKRNIEYR